MSLFLCPPWHEYNDLCTFERRPTLRKLLVWWLILVPVAALAASGDEFYQRLYQRGMAHFTSGNYAEAFTELRNAAFGFVDHVDQFETAQAYATIAAHRLGHDTDARDSLMRIVSAEKIQQHFRSVKLPDDLRAEVDTVAVTLLTSQEATLLGVPASVQDAAPSKPPVVVPTPTKRPNVAVTAPVTRKHDKNDRDTADTAPPAGDPKQTPPKQTTQTPLPITPVPQPVVPAAQPAAPAPQPKGTPAPVTTDPQPVTPSTRPVTPAPQPRPPVPQPVVPVPQPVTPAPQPADPAPQSPRPVPKPTAEPRHDTKPSQPQPVTPDPAPQPAAKNVAASLSDGQRALDNGEIDRARSIYNALLSSSRLPHDQGLRLAEGLYRVHDFTGAARAFQSAGAIGRGEEQYHYYYAVTLYETGHYGEAKRELSAALPHIATTADVARYRAKIEGAIE